MSGTSGQPHADSGAERRRQERRECISTGVLNLGDDSAPCTVVNISGLRKGGLLLPGEPVAMFGTLRDARRAITRTQSAVKHLRGSLVEEWARTKAPLLFSGGEYTLAPLGRQT